MRLLGYFAAQTFTAAYQRVAPIFDFAGDHRYGTIALLFAIGAVAALFLMPVFKRQVAAGLAFIALLVAIYDAGYSRRAKIDRAAWAQAEAARKAAEDKEEQRREDVVDGAFTWAREAAQRLSAEEANRAKQTKEIDDAARSSHRPGLSLPFVLQLDKIR
ncbi:hypothetical protein [Methylocystis sp. SC2]|uniref:hypothetical protein n=1 Tax=Methylocystis sp. (strain SC2) TaxID=187303 RepID=UPI00027AF0FE|nr:hypothetical protein [Methylocystis sp. SC2]CCJ07117.1 Hypothetical protein BN69_1666 [Methylocystis sp. SC2]